LVPSAAGVSHLASSSFHHRGVPLSSRIIRLIPIDDIARSTFRIS
jgi:hypothetical protein